jgi:hypothetical protein
VTKGRRSTFARSLRPGPRRRIKRSGLLSRSRLMHLTMARHRTADADSGSSRTQLIHPSPFRRRESSLSSSEGAQPPLRPLHLRHHNAARDLSRAAAPQLSGRGRSQRTANGRRQRRRRSSAIGPACHRRPTRASAPCLMARVSSSSTPFAKPIAGSAIVIAHPLQATEMSNGLLLPKTDRQKRALGKIESKQRVASCLLKSEKSTHRLRH